MNTMNHEDLIRVLSKRIGTTQKDTAIILDELQTVVFNEIKNGNKIKLFDGVALSGNIKAAKKVRRPSDGVWIDKNAYVAPKCQFTETFKDSLNDR